MKNMFFSSIAKQISWVMIGSILYLIPVNSFSNAKVPDPIIAGNNLNLTNCYTDWSAFQCRNPRALLVSQIVDNFSLNGAYLTKGIIEANVSSATETWKITITFGERCIRKTTCQTSSST